MNGQKLHVELLSDLHGFPTFAVQYQKTRYNFCHLTDVCEFLHKVFNVNNDELLCKQKQHSAKLLYKTVTKPSTIGRVITKLADEQNTVTREEIKNYVASNPALTKRFTIKQVENQITLLLSSGVLERVSRGRYKKVCVDGSTRQLYSVSETQ